MTVSKRTVSGAAILFALMLILILMQNMTLNERISSLETNNDRLRGQLSQISALNQEIAALEKETSIMGEVLATEMELANSYRAIVGTDNRSNLVATAKQIVTETPLDFETAYVLVKHADTFDLNVSLVLSVMELESNFEQYEVGGDDDRGYMQIIPSTEKWLAETYGEAYGLDYDPERIFEPDYNIGLASIYLSLLKNSYGDNYDRILSEYNRGPYNLRDYYLENKTYETAYSRTVLGKEKKYLALNE